jgi:hypothetical protein
MSENTETLISIIFFIGLVFFLGISFGGISKKSERGKDWKPFYDVFLSGGTGCLILIVIVLISLVLGFLFRI